MVLTVVSAQSEGTPWPAARETGGQAKVQQARHNEPNNQRLNLKNIGPKFTLPIIISWSLPIAYPRHWLNWRGCLVEGEKPRQLSLYPSFNSNLAVSSPNVVQGELERPGRAALSKEYIGVPS